MCRREYRVSSSNVEVQWRFLVDVENQWVSRPLIGCRVATSRPADFLGGLCSKSSRTGENFLVLDEDSEVRQT